MLISDVLVPKQPKKKRTRRIVIIGLIITGILSAALALVTYFGFFTGNNYIMLDKELGARGIEISRYKDLRDPTDRLVIEPLGNDGLDEMESSQIKFSIRNSGDEHFGMYQQVENTIGIKYAVYQFYLINQSENAEYVLNVGYSVDITRSTNRLDEALGIRIFISDYDPITQTTTGQEYDSGVLLKENKSLPQPPITNFVPKTVKRITVFFWLEGELTNDTMVNGIIRIRIRLSIGSTVGDV